MWQAFRRAGYDKQLQPETVHHILNLADIAPFELIFTEFGHEDASWDAVQQRHRYVHEQDELCTTLAVDSGSQLLEIVFRVSSRDQVRHPSPSARHKQP